MSEQRLSSNSHQELVVLPLQDEEIRDLHRERRNLGDPVL